MSGRLVAIVPILLLGGCGSGSPDAPATPSPSPVPNASPSPTTAGSPTTNLPEPVAIVQGGRYWAVYAAVADAGSARLDEAFRRLQDQGVEAVSFGELACDRGASEALGVPADQHGVAVFFDTRADAEDFAAGLDPPAAGVARVRTYCAD